MELLEFARGPALTFAITVFIAGTIFRITTLIFMWRTKDSSEGSKREQPAFIAAVKEIARRMWPLPDYKQRTLFTLINGCPTLSKYDLSSIRYCISGGAPLP